MFIVLKNKEYDYHSFPKIIRYDMPIYIYMMDSNFNLITQLGSIDINRVFEVNKQAKKHKLDYLSYLNVARNTIYNHLQIVEIKKEINILKFIEHLKHVLLILENAANEIPDDKKYYLRFIGE